MRTGNDGVQFRNSFMATFDDGRSGFSLGTNIWGGDKGMSEFNQRTGMIGLHFGDFRATYENDGAPRCRTNPFVWFVKFKQKFLSLRY